MIRSQDMYQYWQRRLSSSRSFITTPANVWKPMTTTTITTTTTTTTTATSTTIINHTKNFNKNSIQRLFNLLRTICSEMDSSINYFKLCTGETMLMLSSFLISILLCFLLFIICLVLYMKLKKFLVRGIQNLMIHDQNDQTTETNSIVMLKTPSSNKNNQLTPMSKTNEQVSNNNTNSVLFYDFYSFLHFNFYILLL